MDSTISAAYVFGKAVVVGPIILAGVLVMLRRTPGFRTRRYWFWLAGAACYAGVAPLIYMWIQDFHISYEDAALLRVFRVGSWHVANGYAMLLAMVLARGIDAIALRR